MSKAIWFEINGKWIPGEKPIIVRSEKDRRTQERRKTSDRRQCERSG